MSEVGTILQPVLAPPEVSAEIVLRLQRYRDPARAPDRIRAAAERVVAEASRLVSPQGVIWRGPVTRVDSDGEVTMAGAHHFHSRTLARLLAKSTEALVVVLTVGPEIENRARELKECDQLLDWVLMDTAGWVAIEALVRSLRRDLRTAEKQHGRRLGARFAPGYGDWAVAEQAELFRLFGQIPLPVTLNEAACMSPMKSISAVLGIIPADET